MSHAKELTKQINEFHLYDNVYDDELDIFINQSYADVLKKGKNVDWSKTYFSPSSANKCPRELYHKSKRHKKDPKIWQSHQRRWVQFGEGVAAVLQREFMLSDRHFEKFTGRKPRYSMAFTDEGYPFMEEFVFKQKSFNHDGEEFSILGTLDAVLVDNETGKPLIVELKSKMQTPSKTSQSAMKEAQESHVKQVVCYSLLYDIDEGVIFYQNLAHAGWDMTPEAFQKTPDIRLFDVDISKDSQEEILDFFADITRRLRENDPPLPDLSKWKFNDYKNAISESLTDDEMERLEMVNEFLKESQPVWMQKQMDMALNDIKRRREAIKDVT